MTLTLSQLQDWPWISSSGTLRSEDLLVSFWQTLEEVSRIKERDLIPPSIFASLEKLVGEDSREEDWQEEEASETLASLFDLLSEAAPSGFSFCSHEGDGALFGFWLSEDWLSALEDCDFLEEEPAFCAFFIQSAEEAGLSSDSLLEGFKGEAYGASEEEAGAFFAREHVEEADLLPETFWLRSCLDWEKVWEKLKEEHSFYASPSFKSGTFFIFQAF